MAATSSSPMPEIQIFEETDNYGWKLCGSRLDILEEKTKSNIVVFCPKQEQYIKLDPEYKSRFQEEFSFVTEKDINGSFHCEYSFSNGRITPQVTWACFKLKKVDAPNNYHWKQPCLHINWDHNTGRQLVFIFDFLPQSEHSEFLASIASSADRKCSPFFWHVAFARVVLEQYDQAFWMLRDLVRKQEKERSKPSNPPPNFPLLHDIARHAFHYNETIEVAEHTLQRLVNEQIRWRKEDRDAVVRDLPVWLKTHQALLFEEKRAHSLKTRSKSLNDRHLNEINLGFNLVSQGFGHDARSDSAMMKTIAVVSMVYLPGSFVSGLFGTNFFSFQASQDNTWITSDKFWVYWVVTIPLTLGTMVIWALWHWQERYRRYFGWVSPLLRRFGLYSSSSSSSSSGASSTSSSRLGSTLSFGPGDREKEDGDVGARAFHRRLIRAATTMRPRPRREETV